MVDVNEKIRSILTTEVKFIIAIAAFVFGFVTPVYDMKQDIALVKQDLEFIKSNNTQRINELSIEVKENKKEQDAIKEQVLLLSK